jgi:putative sterol carrier protein
MALFPSEEWLKELIEKLNADQQYAQIAKNWEGDMVFMIEADSTLNEPVIYYLDLWHGKCRDAYPLEDFYSKDPALLMSAPYNTVAQLMKGELEVIQALLTRKISVKGNMVLLMRNVPTVLDFVRCCREITDSYM